MSRRPWLPACAAAAALLAPLGGCVPRGEYDRVAMELERAKERSRELREEAESLRDVVSERDRRISTLTALGERRLEKLFHVARIDVGRHSSGIDTDGRSGDDAVKVFVHPVDNRGSTIKAAGSFRIRLYDLAAAPEETFLGEHTWNVDEAADRWFGGFLTYHYSFVCRWKRRPPRHGEVTARVEFVDYLTGRTFTAQRVCPVKLPSPPATRPAGLGK